MIDKTKTVLTFKHPRVSRVTQEAEGRKHFHGYAPEVLHVGELPRLAIAVAQNSEADDKIWLWALPMIVVSRDKAGVGMQAQITLFCKTIAAHGAEWIEGSTGRVSSNRKQASAAIDEAHRIITKGGKRLPKTNAKPGRKNKFWPSAEVETAARKLWKSKNIGSDAAAVRQIMDQYSDLVDHKGKALVTERLIRALGKSGRNS